MMKLGEKAILVVALFGALLVSVSMYLIPIIKPNDQFLELVLFILGAVLIIFSVIRMKKF
ncbi:hypothetical protein [Streptococcus pacificus]|uniref:Uncharacterized protein n=1 Tax=Streptococcus pacificus TaxID=2740577 RepID=A0ABS0ZGB3_9STRE|nr:hypothetical protein [Streptococcus pacificus]MBJ8325071.1 hypothetical protein [Streptococcus pacificus]